MSLKKVIYFLYRQLNNKRGGIMEARREATKLYTQYFDLEACIKANKYETDLDTLLEELGVELYEVDMRKIFPTKPQANDDVSACIIQKDGRKIIYVNKYEPLVRQRFSVAHELAHLCLGHLTLDEPIDICFRNYNSSTGILRKEVDANKFASTLLMPERMVRKLFDSDYTVIEMAALFSVSKTAMELHLNNLGLKL